MRIDDKTLQQFIILGPKTLRRYLRDPKFLLHDKFEHALKKYALSIKHPSVFTYAKRTEELVTDGIVVLEFEGFTNVPLDDFFFTLTDVVPKIFGCEYCRFNLKEDTSEMIGCDFYGRLVKERTKSCKYFRQAQLFKT
jgi:hypothetical protein